MKACKKLLLLLPPLTTALGLMINATASAQTFSNLHTFTTRSNTVPYGNPDGANPYAGLLLSGTNLYGTAEAEGSSGYYGTLFAVNTNGSNFTTLHNFLNNGTGASPYGGLIISSNILFGTASGGGSGGEGAVFSFNLSTLSSNYTVLHSFAYGTNQLTQSQYPVVINTDGVLPWDGLVMSGDTLYGTTFTGSSNANGAIFAINTNGPVFTNLHIFSAISGYPSYSNSDGASPRGGLISSGGMFYGTTTAGGSNGAGAVFGINTNGSIFTNLHSFAAASNSSPYGNTDGTVPWAGLAISGNTLYGTATAGGSANEGAVFAVNTNGSGFTNLHSFTAATYSAAVGAYTNSDGAVPYAPLLISGNTIYGTTTSGGSNGTGTVFQMNSDGSGFTTLYNFTALAFSSALSVNTNSDGAHPYGGLIISGNVLYGTAEAGGDYGNGTIFSLALPTGPELSAIRSGTNLIITWPANATGFALQSSTNLALTNWTAVSPPPVVVNGQNTVTNAISGTRKFYRLVQ